MYDIIAVIPAIPAIPLLWQILLASLLTGYTGYSLWSGKKAQDQQFQLGNKGIDLEEKKLKAATESELRASKERRAMTQQDILRAMMLKEKDTQTAIGQRREEMNFAREQAGEQRLADKETMNQQFQLAILQALLQRGKSTPGMMDENRIPLTKLIGLGE